MSDIGLSVNSTLRKNPMLDILRQRAARNTRDCGRMLVGFRQPRTTSAGFFLPS